jgi:hypothetical protein
MGAGGRPKVPLLQFEEGHFDLIGPEPFGELFQRIRLDCDREVIPAFTYLKRSSVASLELRRRAGEESPRPIDVFPAQE